MDVEENYDISALFDGINEWLYDENKIVTYRSLSVTFRLHANYAKRVLEDFIKSERAKKLALSVTYCVAGYIADTKQVFKVIVVPDEHIQKTVAAMLPPVSCHVYSVQKSRVQTTDILYMADFDLINANAFDSHRYSSVECPSAVVRSRRTVQPQSTNSVINTQVSHPGPVTAACSKSTEMTTKVTSSAVPTSSTAKSGSSIGRMFASSASKQKQTGKSPSLTADSHQVAAVKPTPTRQSPTESNSASTMSADKPLATNSTSRHKCGKVKCKSTAVCGKRRRIQEVSSSEEDSAVDDNDMMDDDCGVAAEPMESSQQPTSEHVDLEPMSTEHHHCMQRKLVSKTYVNDEGYMVTEKVWESEKVPVTDDKPKSTTTMSAGGSAVVPLSKKGQSNKKSSTAASVSASTKKQSSLMNFFSKS